MEQSKIIDTTETYQGGAPLSFSSSLPSLSSPTPTWKGGVLLPVGVGLLMGRAIGGRPLPLLHSFIYEEGGTPWRHNN